MGSGCGWGGDWLADNRLSSGGSSLSGGWDLRLLCGLGDLLSWLLGSLGRGLALDSGTELGERRLWLLGLIIAGGLLLLGQPWERAFALIALDSWGLGLGLAVGDGSIGRLSWDSGWGSNAGGLEIVRNIFNQQIFKDIPMAR